jgi:hypothetical protein
MAKGDRWSDNQNVEVREMRNAETVLGVIRSHWRAAVRSKDSCPVRRGVIGKGLRKLHLAGRLPYLQARFGGGRMEKGSFPVGRHCRRKRTNKRNPEEAEYLVSRLPDTNAHLPEAFAVARAWGFAYKTLLTWDKHRVGMGDWLRGQTEHALLCVRGRPTVLLGGQTTLIRETSRGHSIKPEAFYALVESLCPGAKLELFARAARPGWESWGHEAATDRPDRD